jgi:tetratricopeptide (TPR) repeat protein
MAVWLVVAGAGCTKDQTVPQALNPTPARAMARKPELVEVAEVTKPKDGPKRTPQAATCAKAGLMFEQAADKTKTELSRRPLIEQARQAYRQALEIDPKNQAALLGQARLYEKEGKYAEAVAIYQKALDAAPKDSVVWFELGMCWGRQKEWAPALTCLQRAASLAPENATYANHLGFALARAERYEESLDRFRRVVGEAQANYNVARMSRHNGRADVCRQYLQAAVAADPQFTDAQHMLAQLNGPAAGGEIRTVAGEQN